MTNAEQFRKIFDMYATEVWSMPEKQFLTWLNSEAKHEPKMGFWMHEYEIVIHDDGVREYVPHTRCAICGMEIDSHSAQFVKFCPNCGTKMRNT